MASDKKMDEMEMITKNYVLSLVNLYGFINAKEAKDFLNIDLETINRRITSKKFLSVIRDLDSVENAVCRILGDNEDDDLNQMTLISGIFFNNGEFCETEYDYVKKCIEDNGGKRFDFHKLSSKKFISYANSYYYEKSKALKDFTTFVQMEYNPNMFKFKEAMTDIMMFTKSFGFAFTIFVQYVRQLEDAIEMKFREEDIPLVFTYFINIFSEQRTWTTGAFKAKDGKNYIDFSQPLVIEALTDGYYGRINPEYYQDKIEELDLDDNKKELLLTQIFIMAAQEELMQKMMNDDLDDDESGTSDYVS